LQKHFVTLVMFNSEHVNTVLDLAPASAIRLLTDKDYQPNCGTPLYDAMGNSLSKLRRQLDTEKKNQVLVTIITDGYENTSKEYSGITIKKMVEELRASGWVFTYIGANQDVDAVADSFSINNRMSFYADEAGVDFMMVKERSSRDRFYQKVSQKINDEDINLDDNYF
jgi:Mg-chelatase subunit ChlD